MQASVNLKGSTLQEGAQPTASVAVSAKGPASKRNRAAQEAVAAAHVRACETFLGAFLMDMLQSPAGEACAIPATWTSALIHLSPPSASRRYYRLIKERVNSSPTDYAQIQVQFAKSVTLVFVQQMVSLCAGDRSSANGDDTALQRPQLARHQWALGRLAELRRCPKHLPFLVPPSYFLFLYLLSSVQYQAAQCADKSKSGIELHVMP